MSCLPENGGIPQILYIIFNIIFSCYFNLTYRFTKCSEYSICLQIKQIVFRLCTDFRCNSDTVIFLLKVVPPESHTGPCTVDSFKPPLTSHGRICRVKDCQSGWAIRPPPCELQLQKQRKLHKTIRRRGLSVWEVTVLFNIRCRPGGQKKHWLVLKI